MAIVIPDAVQLTASTHDAGRVWLRELADLIAGLERDWDITVGAPFTGGTEAYVARATTAAGEPAVLKLSTPAQEGKSDFALEIHALQLAAGRGCARLLAHDVARSAALLEPLGRQLVELGLPVDDQLRAIAATVRQLWLPVPDDTPFPTGAEKGRFLAEYIARAWDELDRPCAERTVATVLDFAERRIAAFDLERAVLVHGDAHQWNTLESPAGGFKLVDPDGLRAEPEYDLAIPMRELDCTRDEGVARSRLLAQLTDTDAPAIWEWGLIERVSTGLLCTRHGMQPEATRMLQTADDWTAA